MRIIYILFILTELVLIKSSPVTETQLATLADALSVRVKMADNLQHSAESHKVTIYLTNNGTEPVPVEGWRLYFYSMYLLYPKIFPKNTSLYLDIEKVKVGMVQGDLYYLEPSTGFVEIKPGEERDYNITIAYWSVSETDFMPNWFLASSDQSQDPVVVKSTALYSLEHVEPFVDVRQWKRFTADRYNPYTPQERMRRLAVEDLRKSGKLIIPTPLDASVIDGDNITIDGSWKIFNNETKFVSSVEYLKELYGFSETSQIEANVITFLKVHNMTSEEYLLHVDPWHSRIYLWSTDPAGMFYAVQSLRSILDGYKRNNIPKIIVQDKPRYHWRGMHLDVARNFHTVEDVKRLIKAMSMYKMNKLHLHLSDDEGWRLEVPALPELTEVGSRRCLDLSEQKCIIPQFGSGPDNSTSGSGYFSTEDYKDILRFAANHHIQVIPEFDMPGHAHAAIASMEQRYRKYDSQGNNVEANKYRLKDPNDDSLYISVQQWMDNAVNPCMNSSYAFIAQVMDTLIQLHSEIQPLEIYNFGGDEVAVGAWENSTLCKTFVENNPKYNATKGLKMYFVERVAKLARDRNLTLAGWEDGYADGNHEPMKGLNDTTHDVYATPWNNIWEWGGGSQAYKLANAGYKVIMAQATNLYFDQPQEPDPKERGLYWATRYTDTHKVLRFMPDSLYDNIVEERSGKPTTKHNICADDMSKCTKLEKPENILGMQGQLWSETLRTSENMDYMIYPRLLALAERAWHKAEFETVKEEDRESAFLEEWQDFANTLGYKELQRLDLMGVKYRVPPPGASVNAEGKVDVTVTYPGLAAQVSYDDGESWTDVTPGLQWKDGEEYIHLRTLSADGTRPSRAVKLFKEEPVPWDDQHMVDYIAENLDVRVKVISNFEKFTFDNIPYVQVEIQLTNTGNFDITVGTWKIYLYSLLGARTQDLSCGLRLEHENGGLYYLTPTSKTFQGIMKGQTLSCVYYNKKWVIARTDNMPKWYVASLGMSPTIIASTQNETLEYVADFIRPAQWKRQENDQYDPLTAAVRYDLYQKYANSARRPYKVIPTPSNLTVDNSQTFTFIPSEWTLVNSSVFSFEASFLSEKLGLSGSRASSKSLVFQKESQQDNNNEAYFLKLEPSQITITAQHSAGALYAVQTLISLLEGNNRKFVKMTIRDKPRYPYRGVMLDTARNFKPKDWILQFLDVMAMYKLNKLHFHLSDDESWRLEIPAIPELTELSSMRCHSDYAGVCVVPQLGSGPHKDTSGSEFYTVQDYREILQYAKERHIEVIPEIDIPGHSEATIAAMDYRESKIQKMKRHGDKNVPESFLLRKDTVPEMSGPGKWQRNALDPCLNTTYRFIETVLDALIEIHRSVQPLGLFHFGGDEVADGVWNDSAACVEMFGPQTETQELQRYFVKRVADIVANKGLNIAAWDDAVYADDRPNPISDYKSNEVYVYTWDNRGANIKRAAEFANSEYKVVMPLATHLYFDQAQEHDPEERGLSWATGYTDTEKTFGLISDDLYANVDVDPMGNNVKHSDICGTQTCPTVNQTENVVGLEACIWSETIRTRDQFHYMVFPRLLAAAERAWHKASWEDISDIEQRKSKQKEDWQAFSDALGFKEFQRLEKYNVSYRIPPPGARVVTGVIKANTKYANLEIQWRKSGDPTWQTFVETSLPAGAHTFHLRSKSKTSDISSREITLSTKIVSSTIKTACSWSLTAIIILLYYCL